VKCIDSSGRENPAETFFLSSSRARKAIPTECSMKVRSVLWRTNPICGTIGISPVQIIVALTLIQLASRMSCSPTYVISAYSNVRIQQPTMGLSVESQMPMDIMLNPVLADEQPSQVDKMESIFMKGDQIKNVKSMNIDEKAIMESINKQITPTDNEQEAKALEEADFVVLSSEKPVGFSVPTNTSTPEQLATDSPLLSLS
jgi:hypothetical protein